MRDWVEWHKEYDDPESYLSQRLRAVISCVRDAFDLVDPGPIRVLSLCAGEGRDVIGAAREHPRGGDVDACLVELDPTLAGRAQRAAGEAGLRVEVRNADAGDPAVYLDRCPVDVLLLVGVFGNITDEDARAAVAAAPSLCRDGATVIWTRHRKAPDLTPRLREWFDAAGCERVGFVSPGPDSWSVGVERVVRAGPAHSVPRRVFTFVDESPPS